MTFQEALTNTNGSEVRSLAAELADPLNLQWDVGIETVLNAVIQNPTHAPSKIKDATLQRMLLKWLKQYKDGLDSRISVRRSKLPGTVPDPIIDLIVGTHLSHLTEENIDKIRYAHRLAMSAENVLGLLLEEYLAEEMIEFGWHCAWGETLRSIDFVNVDGRLRQVKNRSNSENSSSSRVRVGTSIDKWCRVNASTGRYFWDDLNRMNGTTKFSEEKFRAFVLKTIKGNPHALAIEDLNPWRL